MFDLDATAIKNDIEDKTEIKGRWRSIKIIVGRTVGYIAALVFFVLIILYLRRRCKRLEPDEVVLLR